MAENYSRRLDAGIIEVRFNNLQYLQIEDALGRASGLSIVRDSWYRIGFDHKAELSGGRSIILTFPARLGALPAQLYGIKPDARAEWLPVIIRALQKVHGDMQRNLPNLTVCSTWLRLPDASGSLPAGLPWNTCTISPPALRLRRLTR